MKETSDVLNVFDKLKSLLDRYKTPNIANTYISVNVLGFGLMKTDEQKQQIKSNVREVFAKYGKDEHIKAADNNQYGIKAINKF